MPFIFLGPQAAARFRSGGPRWTLTTCFQSIPARRWSAPRGKTSMVRGRLILYRRVTYLLIPSGFWEFQAGYENEPAPFGQQLDMSILVPFPVESCLSGIGLNYQVYQAPLTLSPTSSTDVLQYLWYRQVFPTSWFSSGNTLLHFGSVDWQTRVFVNGQEVCLLSFLYVHDCGYAWL